VLPLQAVTTAVATRQITDHCWQALALLVLLLTARLLPLLASQSWHAPAAVLLLLLLLSAVMLVLAVIIWVLLPLQLLWLSSWLLHCSLPLLQLL
jgi:hypothetical protein